MSKTNENDLPAPLRTKETAAAAPAQAVATQAPSRALNPFEGERKSLVQSSAGAAEIQRAVAETQAAIMLAKQFPRDKVDAVDKILTECTRPTLADAAIYSYPKGGTEVTGASIRLAEVLAMNWGNFTFGWKETGRREIGGVGVSEIQTYAWDYESNVRAVREFSVKHWRDLKGGKGYAIKDERDIYELCANQAARRMRACILQIIPGDVVEAAVSQCETTMTSNENVTPDSIKKLLAAFEGFGVSKGQIEKRLGRKMEIPGVNGAVMAQLRKIYAGLRDGMSKPEEFFEPESGQVATEQPPKGQTSTGAKVEEPSDWDAVVDELALGLQGAADEKTLTAYMEECDPQLKKLSASKDAKAIKKWSDAVAKRRAELTGKLV